MAQGVIGAAQVTLRLPACHSLKEKRQVLAGLLRRVRTKFSVAVAEVSDQDRWQLAGVAVVCVSGDRVHADRVLASTLEFLRAGEGDYHVADVATELITL
ncbi:MAG: DUF503 domain-containing protein [Candidatus Dormibacteraeota bacterium]|nr:DUF503 domain-containing protein [Candidatus Dormibacteraeota bacterium]MBO0744826.1 DUF503 domain-containing protein [Candidatus Dormibacteraeota bacterium]